jgi:hypothetical protein
MDDIFKEYYDIYHEMLETEVGNRDFYLISYRPLPGQHSFVSINNTVWVSREKRWDIRKADLVDPVVVKSHFKLLNIPLASVGNNKELTTFLRIGGHALIEEGIIASNWKDILNPRIVIETYEEGFIDYETITKKFKSRFARGNFRTEIFDRDNYQCKVCGSSPDDNIHVRLEVHHIKPWEEGGISTPDNLITLCDLCHEGASKINREVLYRKIGLHFPNAKNKFFEEDLTWSYDKRFSFRQVLNDNVTLRVTNCR